MSQKFKINNEKINLCTTLLFILHTRKLIILNDEFNDFYSAKKAETGFNSIKTSFNLK